MPCPQSYFYCRFPLNNSIGQFILSATLGHDENHQRKVTVINFEYPQCRNKCIEAKKTGQLYLLSEAQETTSPQPSLMRKPP